jgi:tetratricopeptide (TPR) repeat protein
MEGINVLERLIRPGVPRAITYKLLGEMYQELGLISKAKERYEKGLQLAMQTENQEIKGFIHWKLGEISYQLGAREEAIVSLEKAKAIYHDLGDKQQVQALEGLITQFAL